MTDVQGVTNSRVVETAMGTLVTFRDPDNIQLELFFLISILTLTALLLPPPRLGRAAIPLACRQDAERKPSYL